MDFVSLLREFGHISLPKTVKSEWGTYINVHTKFVRSHVKEVKGKDFETKDRVYRFVLIHFKRHGLLEVSSKDFHST